METYERGKVALQNLRSFSMWFHQLMICSVHKSEVVTKLQLHTHLQASRDEPGICQSLDTDTDLGEVQHRCKGVCAMASYASRSPLPCRDIWQARADVLRPSIYWLSLKEAFGYWFLVNHVAVNPFLGLKSYSRRDSDRWASSSCYGNGWSEHETCAVIVPHDATEMDESNRG